MTTLAKIASSLPRNSPLASATFKLRHYRADQPLDKGTKREHNRARLEEVAMVRGFVGDVFELLSLGLFAVMIAVWALA